MPRRLTTKEFVDKAQAVHQGVYDYSLTVYDKKSTRVQIVCPVHGKFEQRADNHLRGAGCQRCGRAKKKLNYVMSQKGKDNIRLSHHKHYKTYSKSHRENISKSMIRYIASLTPEQFKQRHIVTRTEAEPISYELPQIII